jgi:hypothetical protein
MRKKFTLQLAAESNISTTDFIVYATSAIHVLLLHSMSPAAATRFQIVFFARCNVQSIHILFGLISILCSVFDPTCLAEENLSDVSSHSSSRLPLGSASAKL